MEQTAQEAAKLKMGFATDTFPMCQYSTAAKNIGWLNVSSITPIKKYAHNTSTAF